MLNFNSPLYPLEDLLPDQLRSIPFDQSLITSQLRHKHKTLRKFDRKYGGLCELICNYLLIENSLGQGNDLDALIDRITIEKLDEVTIKKSHLLKVYSVFERIKAFLFGIYPDNIFSNSHQWKLVSRKSINRHVLARGLQNIEEGKTLKLEVFSKKDLKFSGHASLLKKISSHEYIFFDPNIGEHRKQTLDQVSDEIDQQLKRLNGTDVFITKGEDFLKRLRKKNGQLV